MSKRSGSKDSRAGWLLRQDNLGSFARVYGLLKARELYLYPSDNRDEEPLIFYDLEGAAVGAPDATKVAKRFSMEVATRGGQVAVLCAESKDEQEAWLQALSCAAVPEAWPGGLDLAKRPQPLLYSMWILRHTPPGRGGNRYGPPAQPQAGKNGSTAGAGTPNGAASGAGVGAQAAATSTGSGVSSNNSSSSNSSAAGSPPAAPPVPSPFPKLPALKSSPAWQRKSLLLQKLRWAALVFDGVDASIGIEDREYKRNTLLEVVDYADAAGRALFADVRVLEDTFTMIRLTLFRTLPRAPAPSGDPDEEETAFSDPTWPHLNIVYELLLRLVSMDHIDLTLKKRVIDPAFVRQLLLLFDSEDPRERDYLKTITHRIYSKLTQRRALVRRVICNVFFEFIYETERHNGIAEMLEILASIINGFAVPIKDDHKTMLTKALLPLHKAKAIAGYHPQLSYCMALYVAKDHVLTREVIPGLLKFWPFGNSQKQIMFINELEDIFEYVQEDDMEAVRLPLALRLNRTIGGQHFQVAERALLLWNSERFLSLMMENGANRCVVLPVLFPALFSNQEQHWHESIRTLSSRILEKYAEVDPDLVERCGAELESRLESDAQQAAAAAAAAAAAGAAGGLDAAASSSTVVDGLAGALGGMSLSPAGEDAGAEGGDAAGDASGGGLSIRSPEGKASSISGRQEAGAGAAATPLPAPSLSLGGQQLTPRSGTTPASSQSPSTLAGSSSGGSAAAGVAMGMMSAGLLHGSHGTGHGHLAPVTHSGSPGAPPGAGGAGGVGGAGAGGGLLAAGGLGGGLGGASPAGVGVGGGHHHLPHRAPAVRGATVFAVQSDILPAHAQRGGLGSDGTVTPSKKPFMSLPLAGGEGGMEGGE